jgi:hypothetical protein
LISARATGRVQESQVERRVVAHQHGPAAFLHLHGITHLGEDAPERVLLRDGGPQRVPRVDAVDGERGRLEIRAFERAHVVRVRFAATQAAVRPELDQHRGDFQQRVGGAVEAAGLHVDDHGQEGAEAPMHQRRARESAVVGRWHEFLHHAASCQAMVSPARIGTSRSCPPIG